MLKSLLISNYALIDNVEIDFDKGFSVITGETGAGKSIILGALGLVLGQRGDLSVLKNKDKKSVIEAVFDVSKYNFQDIFNEHSVDYDDETIIRREIQPSGKSRSFVNDMPVTQGFLKNLSPLLIDIHSQHQNLLLGDSKFQLNVVDSVAENKKELDDYSLIFNEYHSLIKEKNNLEIQNAELKQNNDFMLFQFNELNDIKLVDNEETELEAELDVLSNAEEIKSIIYDAVNKFNGEENPILSSLKEISKQFTKVQKFLPQANEWQERTESAFIDLNDLLSDLESKLDSIEDDPERLNFIDERLGVINNLFQKHRVNSVSELIEIKNNLEQKLNKISSFDDELNEINNKISEKKKQLTRAASVLSSSRTKVIEKIENTLISQLQELGMPNAQIKIVCDKLNDFSASGVDDIYFSFSANKNGELSSITKVASGGEMSRVMLCIKLLLSDAKNLPSIIFDEIDTGVSGEVAHKMGHIMQNIADNIQVICITHLPQIAVKGKNHFMVYKTDNDDSTSTKISLLSQKERENEIAKMLSGSNITDAAITNAKELLKLAKQ